MDLGSVFNRVSERFSGKIEKPESYLAVKISSSSIVAVVWSVEAGKVILSEAGSAKFASDSWDDLLKSADKAISQALINTSPDVNKVVFAVPYDWVIEGKIKPEHLNNLRRLCKELDLFPQGFVVLTEALENYYKETEGAPLTAILVGIDGKDSTLTMYRAGRNLGTVPIPQEGFSPDEIPPAMEKALKRFTGEEVFPSRIIIYDGKGDLESVGEKITAFPWTKQLPFLHFPKVETAPAEMVAKAVAIAGGMQMGGKFDAAQEGASEEKSVSEPQPATVHEEKERERQQAEQKEEALVELEEISAEEAGFKVNGASSDITFPVKKQQEEEIVEKAIPEVPSPTGPLGQLEEMLSEELPGRKPVSASPVIKLPLQSLKSLLSKINFSALLKNFLPSKTASMGSAPSRPKLMLPAIVAVLLILLVSVSAVAYFVPKVSIITHVRGKQFNHDLSVLVVTDSTKPTATSAAILAGSFVDVSETGSKRGIATGKKLVGDKAKGTVTIGNPSDARTFAAGTILTSASGLKFVLDSDVPVSSGSGVYALAIATTSVTAADIGDQYNLPAQTLFSISNFSGQAKNDAAFTGGNSHQATVVTADDQSRLSATLSAELTGKAQSDLQAKVGSDQKLLPNAITSSISKKKFSKDVNNEADTVTLDLSIDFRGVVLSRTDIVNLFVSKFSPDIPDGYQLDSNRAEVNVRSAKTDKNGTTLSINLTANLALKMDTNSLISKISGKSPSFVTSLLTSQPGVSSAEIDTRPKFLEPIVNFALPWRRENIKLEIVSD